MTGGELPQPYEGQELPCQVRYSNCTAIATTHIYCSVEKRSILSCQYCFVVWRHKVRDEAHHALDVRCPACSDWHPARMGPPAAAASVPLAGAAAQAINAAMWQQGLTAPDRQGVLEKLHVNADWLEHMHEAERSP